MSDNIPTEVIRPTQSAPVQTQSGTASVPSGTPLPTAGGYAGQAWFQTAGSESQALDFLFRQIIAGKAFSGLVAVRTVHGGGVGAPPTVDVQPLINQQDLLGNQVPHGVVFGMPCFRLQSGLGAVILDPVAGDIGMAVICDRDISAVKATGKASPPGSYREQSWSDGCYFGSFLGGAPTQYVQITQSGINIVSNGIISLSAGGHSITIGSSGVVIDGTVWSTHEHTGVTTGADQTGPVA
jgi:hypothetical protein